LRWQLFEALFETSFWQTVQLDQPPVDIQSAEGLPGIMPSKCESMWAFNPAKLRHPMCVLDDWAGHPTTGQRMICCSCCPCGWACCGAPPGAAVPSAPAGG
jgi:hypothetical protein